MRRRCTGCGVKKSLEGEFYTNPRYKGGYMRRCKSCVRTYKNAHKKPLTETQLERHRAYMRQRMFLHNLKKLYGMTLEQYQDLLAAQANRCAICNRLFKKTPLIDHCHKTGKVRGLLCRACNTGIGSFRDDPTLTEAATRYLQNSGET